MEKEWTIDDLAREAGTTTRNIRSYQTRGILPPPRMVGRVGYYNEGHLARLKYTDNLQDRGFSLAAIACLLDAWEEGRSLQDVLGFEEALMAPWSDEEPGHFNIERLQEMFPEVVDQPALLQRAIGLGLLRPDQDGYVAPSPRLIRNGAELASAGVPLATVLNQYEELAADLRHIAERFVTVFEEYVWEPFVQAGMPMERLPEITESLQRMRPAASSSMDTVFAQQMEEAVQVSTARQVARMMGQTSLEASGS
ncbi:MAG TPA: MerR family transcriptional regulator [Actinomycetota bacterium]|nr:MerR family transcriptional regulator [Actinomycetota bacterium]